jgi:DNA replication protein DnaD
MMSEQQFSDMFDYFCMIDMIVPLQNEGRTCEKEVSTGNSTLVRESLRIAVFLPLAQVQRWT